MKPEAHPIALAWVGSSLLQEHYRDLDISFNEDNDWRYLFIVKRHWLRKQKKLHNGHWVCHYCNEPIYKQAPRNKGNSMKNTKLWITVDHMTPASKCNDILDTSNFAESCYKCNNKKRDMTYNNFLIKKNKNIVTS